MAISRRYFADEDFVLTWIHGSVDDLQLHEHVIALNQESRAMGAFSELADCRDVEDFEGITNQGMVIAAQLESFRPTSRRGQLAIVVREPEHLTIVRIYQAVCEGFRRAVLATLDYDEALAWLAVGSLADSIQSYKLDAMNAGGRP